MTTKRDITVKTLSNHLLQMKFMRKSVLAASEKEKEELFQIDDEHWVVHESLNQTSRFFSRAPEVLSSYSSLQDLKFGRMSFKGFNPEVERLMKFYEFGGEERESEEEAREKAEEMEFAKEFTDVTSSIAKKFTKKRDRGDEMFSKQQQPVVKKKKKHKVNKAE